MTMEKCLGRLITLTLVGMFLSGCAASAYLGYTISPDYPRDETETIQVPDMQQEVKIYLDEMGVAHIDAQSEEDLVRAIGFVQGRSRYFQMDTLRRFARGRLSELLGEQKIQFGTTFKLDSTMRAWGFEALATDDAASLAPEEEKLMKAYCAGVNRALELYPPVEYRLLGLEPEPWTIADSFAVGRLVGWSISHNWHQELSRMVIALHAGAERGEKIYNNDAWPGNTSVKLDSTAKKLHPGIVPELIAMFPDRKGQPTRLPEKTVARGLESSLTMFGGASNAWVIGPGRTVSGKPILANDPHLSHLLPSLLFQQHLHCADLDVIGVTTPGLPYILIGHNRQVAWGMTSAVGDVIDLYIEMIDPENPNQVLGPTGSEPLTVRTETIRVRRDGELQDEQIKIRVTARGPLVNDMYPDLLPDWAPLVSLRWDSSGAGKSIAGLSRANRAKTVAELRQALLELPTPINSVMAADIHGTVALFPTGRLPVRKGHRGTFPAPAWLPDYDWSGSVKPQDMPLFKAGPDQFLAHGNNLMYDPARGPVFMHVDSAPAYRLDRISELLAARDKHDLDSTSSLQHDILLHRARRLIGPLLKDLAGLDGLWPREEKSLALLASWDHRAEIASPAAIIFFSTYRRAIVKAMADEVDGKGLEYLLSQRYFTNAADLWFDELDHPVWDDRTTEAIETRAQIVRAAFREAVVELRETQGGQPDQWRWGLVHFQQSRHPFGGKLPSFNLPQIEAQGGPDSVWKSHVDLGNSEHPFKAVAGPVLRMIVDLADMDHGLWVVDTGVSGWPGSPHYGDQNQLWKSERYAPMCTNWDEIRQKAPAVLTLR